jgi:hypothetical protein
MANAKQPQAQRFKTAKVTAKVRGVKAKAWTIVAKEMQVIARNEIKKPVGIRRGPKGGVHKVRSKPGQPPRRDSGNLYAGTTVRYDAKKSQVVFETLGYGRILDSRDYRHGQRPWTHVLVNRQGNIQKTWRTRATEVMRTLAGK